MVIELDARSLMKRAIIILVALSSSLLFAWALARNFIAGVLTDDRVTPSRELLVWGLGSAPDSALLQARLAGAQMFDDDRDLSEMEARALRAINISPWDYRHRLLLATIREAAGDREAAEAALRDALALAPNYTDVHWRLANLLIRQGKLGASITEFRKAVSANPAHLPATLDLIWRTSGENLAAVKAVTPVAPRHRLLLAHFLLNQKRPREAVEVFGQIDVKARLASPDSPPFIGGLIARGHRAVAREAWINLVGGEHPGPLVWNGGFESNILAQFSHFDWVIIPSEYARLSVDDRVAHAGSRSLRIDFLGRDTTRLVGEIKQLLVVRPGARYRLEFFVKADGLQSPEGPRVVVMDGGLTKEVAASEPIASGSYDWQKVALDFTAPAGSDAVVIYFKRVPEFSYDEPTRGTVWFDDFTLTEVSGK
jgi:hypothetical protein